MSVIKNKRSVSGVQFLDTARELQIFTMRTCSKFPKHYNPFLNWPIIQQSVNVHNLVKKGNSIFPSNLGEYELRRQQFVMALAELQAMVSQINIAYDTFPVEDKKIEKWMELISKETALIKSVIKSDKEKNKF